MMGAMSVVTAEFMVNGTRKRKMTRTRMQVFTQEGLGECERYVAVRVPAGLPDMMIIPNAFRQNVVPM